MFNIGQRIVCVNDNFNNVPVAYYKYYSNFPLKDEIYTVSNITQGFGNNPKEAEEVVVHLKEIANPPNKLGVENGYNVERFRPLVASEELAKKEEENLNTV